MNRLLERLPIDALDRVWLAMLESRLRTEISRAGAGQRLRVDGVPRTLLEKVAVHLHADPGFAAEVCFVDHQGGPESWRVGVHKVVERRNDEAGVLVVLLPPDVRLAAGDSIDVSTFRAVATDALATEVEEFLYDAIPDGLVPLVRMVLEDLTSRSRPVSMSARLAFLATVANQPSHEPWVVGGALFTLGLIPDFELFDEPGQLHYRIGQRNLRLAVDTLRDPARTPLEKVMRLPLTDSDFRTQLLSLFEQVQPEAIGQWGAMVATEGEWRSLSLEHWPFEVTTPPGSVVIDLELLKLPARDDGVLVYDLRERLRVGWRTTPPANDVPGLTHFRIEVVRSDLVVAWESPLIKVNAAARRSKELKDLDLDPDVYFIRVVGLTATGDPFGDQPLRDPEEGESGKRTNESSDFVVISPTDAADEDLSPVVVTTVSSFAEAELLARSAAVSARRPLSSLPEPERSWLVPLDSAAELATASVRFEAHRQFTVRLSQRLRRLEIEILNHPEIDGGREIELGQQASLPFGGGRPLPRSFAEVRRRVFDAILSTSVAEGSAVVALADLCGIAQLIEDYTTEYERWLPSDDPGAAALDVVHAALPGVGRVALLSPTHPLRLVWLLQEQQLERNWTAEAAERSTVPNDLVGAWRRAFSATGIPPLVIVGPGEQYVDAGPLPGGWGAFISPRLPDSRSAIALLRRRLGAGAAHTSEADIAPRILADRLETFVQQHAYTPSLVLNVVNPGDGALIVDALIDLESRLGPGVAMRYEVRLFAESDDPKAVGQAFRDLMEPERQLSEAAARLAGPGRSFLFPKLSWSRKPLTSFLSQPRDFSSHLTLILDHFGTKITVAAFDKNDRSSFVYGLVQEAPQRFVGRGSAFRWIRRPAPTPCPDLPTAEGRSSRLAQVVRKLGAAQASLLTAGRTAEDHTAVSELDLDPSAQSLLYSAHNVSTWVLTLDANLGLDYFDARGRLDRPGYLLDFTPEFSPSSGRQLLLTTRIDEELVRLVAPLLDQLGLDPDGPGAKLIVESLRALSGRLALRLASSPSQRQGVLGMALAKLFLESFGLLTESVVIPLDAHPELAKKAVGAVSPEMRSDLLVVSADPPIDHLDFLVVEAKCFVGAGLGAELRERIDAQTASSIQGLRDAFEIAENDDRIDRQVQSWKLTSVLSFYLERAIRYGLVGREAAELLRGFFQRLDRGYQLSFRRIGLVFRHESASTFCDRDDPELPIWVIGRDVIDAMITDALEAFITSPGPEAEHAEVAFAMAAKEPIQGTLTSQPTWEDVRRDFSGPSPTRSSDARPLRVPHAAQTVGVGEARLDADTRASVRGLAQPEVRPDQAPRSKEEVSSLADWVELAERAGPTAVSAAGPEVDVLIGDNKLTSQYGLLGVVAAEPFRRVGLDLNGCNTVSVFGVQGGGKSYTLGSVLEMAVREIRGLNLLPSPLGAVVFHYHQTQDYPPEFVSMVGPNDEPSEVSALAAYGAVPVGIEDLLVVTTSDMVKHRQMEFPGVPVEAIQFSSREISIADWRFLMGATGNDALYLKVLNQAMQGARHNLTLETIRDALSHAPMSDSQRALATTRLELAGRFIDDSRSLRSLLHPGRVVVVDLRDEFIERDEALGLFVTMLNVFAGAGMGEAPFNKVIVFDEAHKYMGGSLIGQVVEVIREMRHKGVSVVVASQDPVNVPQAVVELSSSVVLHRFNSPNWLKHIQRSLASLGDLTPTMLSSLATGEAFVWGNRATDPVFTRRAVKVRMRPRATKHGGSTRKAVPL